MAQSQAVAFHWLTSLFTCVHLQLLSETPPPQRASAVPVSKRTLSAHCCPDTPKPWALQAVVAVASRSNPGVPPGSLTSFLRAKPSVAAAALTDFDSAFCNRFYGSRFDNGSNADVGSVAAAAAVAARALHALAAGPDAAPLQVQLCISAWRSRNQDPARVSDQLDIGWIPLLTNEVNPHVCHGLVSVCSGIFGPRSCVQLLLENWPDNGGWRPQVNQMVVAELVSELWGCLVLAEPGLGCALVQRLTATSGAPPQHYLGILHTLTAGSQVCSAALLCFQQKSEAAAWTAAGAAAWRQS